MTSPLPVADAGVADMFTRKFTSVPGVSFRKALGLGAIDPTNAPSSDSISNAA